MTTGSAKIGTTEWPIGAILVKARRLTDAQVEAILQLQAETGQLFGEAGKQLGLLTDADVMHALAEQFQYPYLPAGPNWPISEEVVAAYEPFSPEGERLRALRSQLQVHWLEASPKRTALTIVGSSRSEGRSRLAANLAVAFAQAGQRTLLIDGDMRTPRQHLLFKLKPANQGLSTLLAGRPFGQAVSFTPGIPGLGVLPAGPVPPNPVELLSRTTFDRILQQSMSAFDVVIIDTPSLQCGADAMLLSRAAGASLAVARTHLTRTKEFRQMVAYLRTSGVHVVGSALLGSASAVPNA
jgi:receptor protein-tyrosine kinase